MYETEFAFVSARVFLAQEIPDDDQMELHHIARSWLLNDPSLQDLAVSVAEAYKLGKGVPDDN